MAEQTPETDVRLGAGDPSVDEGGAEQSVQEADLAAAERFDAAEDDPQSAEDDESAAAPAVEEPVAGGRDATADDHHLRVERRDEVGGADAEPVTD